MAQKIVRASDGKDVTAEKKPAVTGKTAQAIKKPAAAKAEPAAEQPKKPQTVVAPNKPTGGSTVGLRIGAIVCWVLAILCEVACILFLTDTLYLKIGKTVGLIIGIVLDMALCILAAQLWKKANHIKPMSGKNKVLFYVWSELGVIMACICFIPLIVFLLKDKKLDKKSKLIVTIIAVVALLITGVASADFNPITAEQKEEAESVITSDVFWTTFGHKYHIDQDCQAIRNSSTIYTGTVTEAIEAGRTALCTFCARNHPELDTEGLKVEDGAPAVEVVEQTP